MKKSLSNAMQDSNYFMKAASQQIAKLCQISIFSLHSTILLHIFIVFTQLHFTKVKIHLEKCEVRSDDLLFPKAF